MFGGKHLSFDQIIETPPYDKISNRTSQRTLNSTNIPGGASYGKQMRNRSSSDFQKMKPPSQYYIGWQNYYK